MDLLEPIIKPYAWGSREALARLRGGDVPSAGPEAELWMGDHPAGPAGVTRDGRARTLTDVVHDDPERELGADCVARFGGRLPFLLKVLAADQPLSIQVHPDREQALAAFTAQTANGGEGPYSDDWPKPELLYALSPFEVLAGFRDRAQAAAVLDGLGVRSLRPVIGLLGAEGEGTGLMAALRTLLEWPEPDRASLVREVVAASARLADAAGPHAAAYGAVVAMARHHADDIGLVASLLMRHQVLDAGTALYMPAGGLHAYVRGVGVEIMAASDNVLRAGLTTKEVDVPELLRITDPTVRVPVVEPGEVAGRGRTHVYDCPAEEFALYRTELTATPVPLVPSAGPRIVLCTAGDARLRSPDGGVLTLQRADSCFVPDSDRGVTAEGTGTLFVAGTGLAVHRPRRLPDGPLRHRHTA
ncbi:mannose-6-phosphate isomerase, class I [Streptomyces fumanus]|uniref:mannose-6-phosphate isomerase n=1 Tax=Streptomyces fumanus TaxID=67302 RepID=A0A919AC12_9ACTN|nr:mannose-6-phosphate isomerase, class I [Streptomyces fumanus]GHE96989.1 putative mannose-6-phosphate isomerase ManA [Streptomyces fumanus]